MDKVVYILGAGFSAPLGLPVMSNFLVKAKDMFAAAPVELRSFEKVFKTLDEMSVCKNYYNANLFNIEEVLSILEMKRSLNRERKTKQFSDFIVSVIRHYTPSIKLPERQGLPSNWEAVVFKQELGYTHHVQFVASLFNLEFEQVEEHRHRPLVYLLGTSPVAEYAVIMRGLSVFDGE